jgi:hypothetical protein
MWPDGINLRPHIAEVVGPEVEGTMADFHYRHFIYVDSDEILNTAAIMEGGLVDEEIQTLTKGFGGNIGAKFGFAALGASVGLQGNRLFKKEWKLRRTAYVAADKVLDKITTNDKVAEKASSISENAIVRCDINLRPLCSRPDGQQSHVDVDRLIRPWWQRLFTADPTVEAGRQNVYRYGKRQTMEVAMFGRDGNELTGPSLLLVLEPRWVLKPSEFSRRATIVGQVIGAKRNGEELIPAHDSYGPWFEFRRQTVPESVGQPPKKVPSQPDDEQRKRLFGVSGQGKDTEGTSTAFSDVPSTEPTQDNRLQVDRQHPSAPTKSHGRLRRFFSRKGKNATVDVEGAATIDLGRNPDGDEKEFWHASLVLRPIVIFK